MAAEYIVSRGNYQVALCERGIRTFETMTRNTLDLNAVPVLKALTHLPVVVDPSHGIGLRAHVAAMARAGIAAGADGLIVEVHPHPEKALSDGQQSLTPREFEELMRQVRVIAGAPLARSGCRRCTHRTRISGPPGSSPTSPTSAWPSRKRSWMMCMASAKRLTR